MRLPHILLAVLLMMVWGIQFTMIHIAVKTIPPFLLCSLRFFFTSIPLVFFIKKPQIPFKLILLYGWLTFAAQYSLFFIAMRVGMPAGLASLVYQIQILINIGLAYFFFNERITLWQVIGIFIAFLGLAIVALHLEVKTTLFGFCLTIMAASVWAFGNMASKKSGKINMISLVVWGNLVSFPPLFIMTWWLEGPSKIIHTWQNFSWLTFAAVSYIVYLSTLLAFSLWSWLLSLYPVKTVVPFMLLVPLVGMLSAFFILGEPLPLWKLYAAALIIGGLCINFLSSHLIKSPTSNKIPSSTL
jgi:O-acetylserine/cysteine efflux transporter